VSKKFNEEIYNEEIEFDHELKELLNEIMISRDHYVKIFESVLGFY
jgi:hypothetical protein